MGAPGFSPVINRLLSACFVLALGTPLVATLAGVDRTPALEENRERAAWPGTPASRAEWAQWPGALTQWFTDHVAFRTDLIRTQARVRVQALRSSANPDVIVGTDGWLYYTDDGGLEEIGAHRSFTDEELEAWRTTLTHTRDWLQARGIAYLFVIAPDKPVIYPEHLPATVQRVGTQSRTAQLMRHLRAHDPLPVLDLTDTLREARRHERVYHLTDTHWNELGAYAAYRRMIDELQPVGVGEPRPRHDFRVVPFTRPGMDLARMLGLMSVMQEVDLRLEFAAPRRATVIEPNPPSRALMDARVVTTQPGPWPRAVVFRDSGGSAMIPYLSEHFGRAVYAWQPNIDLELITREQPTVVIQEWVGRHFYRVYPYDAVAAQQ